MKMTTKQQGNLMSGVDPLTGEILTVIGRCAGGPLTEGAAIAIFLRISKRFGWKGIPFLRGDLEGAVRKLNEDGDEFFDELTPKEIAALAQTAAWKTLDYSITEAVMDILNQIEIVRHPGGEFTITEGEKK
jgi:hypothetical protein